MKDLNRLNDKLDNDLELCPDGRETDPDTGLDGDYFDETIENDGISGDDVNRRLREKRLGFKAPSEDWDQAGTVIHCIYPEQVPTKSLASVILYNMHLSGPIGFIAESLDEILANHEAMHVKVQEKLDGARVTAETVDTWNCGACVNSGVSCAKEPCRTCLNTPGNGNYVPAPDASICNKCGRNLEPDGTCGNLYCHGENEKPVNEAYHTESAFARVSGVAQSAYEKWARDCQPVCNDNDDEGGCTNYDNDTRECVFTDCTRVWNNNS